MVQYDRSLKMLLNKNHDWKFVKALKKVRKKSTFYSKGLFLEFESFWPQVCNARFCFCKNCMWTKLLKWSASSPHCKTQRSSIEELVQGDQTAEMGIQLVLILHKRHHFPQLWCILGLESVFLYQKLRNIDISTSIFQLWSILVQSRLVKIGPDCHRLVQTPDWPDWSRLVQIGPDWCRLVQVGLIGPDWSR